MVFAVLIFSEGFGFATLKKKKLHKSAKSYLVEIVIAQFVIIWLVVANIAICFNSLMKLFFSKGNVLLTY